jgi:hypothetical protein
MRGAVAFHQDEEEDPAELIVNPASLYGPSTPLSAPEGVPSVGYFRHRTSSGEQPDDMQYTIIFPPQRGTAEVRLASQA